MPRPIAGHGHGKQLVVGQAQANQLLEYGQRLGGVWRLLAIALSILPRPLADAGYDLIAAVRLRLAPTPDEACPLLPPRLRTRFDP